MDLVQAKTYADAYLKRNAIDSIHYVAFGKCLKRDLIEKFGLDTPNAEVMIAAIVQDLIRKINA